MSSLSSSFGMAPLLFVLLSLLAFSSRCSATDFSVLSYGAEPDGKTDSTKAFLAAWAAACGSATPGAVYVPPGRFSLGVAVFDGRGCKNKAVEVRMDGTLIANTGAVPDGDYWVLFRNVDGLKISGGVLDGQGSGIWACKKTGKNCPEGLTSLRILDSSNVVVSGLTSVNSQMFNIVILSCKNVQFQGVKVSNPGDSPNTDGIHVQGSSGVSILTSKISTGDDCVSVGPGTQGLWVEDMACGPGHGVSIGSLGRDSDEEGVQNVTVKAATFSGTQNGVRIKTWARPSNGFVRDVLFQDCVMNDAQNPIVIDQNYCPHDDDCPNQVSGIRISGVTYQNIHGTSATEVGVKLDCSPANPCTGVKMMDVKLTYNNQPAQAICTHVGGNAFGLIQLDSCFL